MLGNSSTKDEDMDAIEQLDQFLYSLNLICCVFAALRNNSFELVCIS